MILDKRCRYDNVGQIARISSDPLYLADAEIYAYTYIDIPYVGINVSEYTCQYK